MRERLIDLIGADTSEAILVELSGLGTAARAAGDLEAAALARSLEACQARFLGKQQHAVVTGAELLELWPELKKRPLPEDDELDLRRRLVWGMKYVAGSAMDLPEIPLLTTDQLLAVLSEMLTHYNYQPIAFWALDARRAYIAGDEERLKERVRQLTSTVTRYNHVYQCADCPGCVLLQFVEWMGPDAPDSDVEEVLGPILGTKPFQPDPEGMKSLLDLLYGAIGACENAERSLPVKLARAYLKAGRLGEALQQAERGLVLAEGTEAERRARALLARTAVATALKQPEASELARELVERAHTLEDAYEQLDAYVTAHAARKDASVAQKARALATRLDARIDRKRHVVATEKSLTS